MQDAVDTMLSVYKVAANDAAAKIRANLAALKVDGKDFEFLFNDRAALIGKSLDDLKLLIKSRIDAHKAAKAADEEATRERIRAEEQAKAEKKVREKAAAEQTAFEKQEQEEIERLAKLNSSLIVAAPVIAEPTGPRMVLTPRPAVAAKSSTPPSLNLGTICARLGIGLTKDFLSESLAIEPAARDRSAVLYREEDFLLICDALQKHIYNVACDFVPVSA